MSTCARCGLSKDGRLGSCSAGLGSAIGDLTCRDHELANLRSLLRSVTGKLEEAATRLTNVTPEAATQVAIALGLIDAVLETLS